MWWQWGVGLCIVAFLLLVAFAVRLLHKAQDSLKRADEAMEAMQLQLKETGAESARLMEASTALAQDLHRKLQAVEAWTEAAAQTGDAIRGVSRSVKAVSETVEHTVREAKRAAANQQDTAREIMELTRAGLQLWHRWQASGRNQSKE